MIAGAAVPGASRGRLALLRTVAVLAIAGGLSLGASTALAELVPVPETGRAGYLELSADPYPADFGTITPGQTVPWVIETRLADADSSTLSLQLRGWGELVEHLNGLNIAVEACPTAYTGDQPSCTAGGAPVVGPAPLGSVATRTSSDTWALDPLVRGEPRQLLVELSLPAEGADDETLQALTGNVAVGLYASGEGPAAATPSPPSLPATGANVLSIVLVALGAVVLGLTMRHRAGGPVTS